ncbi:MAG: 30S ribosomal protein S6 [bacterium]
MAQYELLYIIPGKYTEEEVGPIRTAVKGLLVKNQAQLIRELDLGKKKLAYPIQQDHYGYYILTDFDAPGESVAKLESALKLMPEIRRHQIVHRLEAAKTTGQEPIMRPKTEELILATPTESLITQVTAESAQIPPPIKKSKISLDELDQKLDELLKEDII